MLGRDMGRGRKPATRGPRVGRVRGGEPDSPTQRQRASIQIAHDTGITYETAIDQQGELFRAFGGLGMLVTLFIQPGGGIVEIFTGEPSTAALWSRIEQHFAVIWQ